MVYSDDCFADPVALGNALAQYVDIGGGVLVAGAAFATVSPNASDPAAGNATGAVTACMTLQGNFAAVSTPPAGSTAGNATDTVRLPYHLVTATGAVASVGGASAAAVLVRAHIRSLTT